MGDGFRTRVRIYTDAGSSARLGSYCIEMIKKSTGQFGYIVGPGELTGVTNLR
jgi:hypothetical protein